MLCKHPSTMEAICSGLALQLPGPHLDLMLPSSQRTGEQRVLQALHHLHINLEVSHLRLACRHGRHEGGSCTGLYTGDTLADGLSLSQKPSR